MYKAAGKLVLDNSILTVGSKSSVLLVARYSRGSDTKSPYKIVGAKYQRSEFRHLFDIFMVKLFDICFAICHSICIVFFRRK